MNSKAKKPKNNIILIICDCLRADHAYNPKIMPFLNSFKDKNYFSNRSYTNATSTFFAMPTQLTGYLPFEVTNKPGINSRNQDKFLPRLFKEFNYKTIGITANIVTSRAFGYMKHWDYFDDFWNRNKTINQIKNRIFYRLPKIFKTLINYPISILKLFLKTPNTAKDNIRGYKITESLIKIPDIKKTGNFIFLHFMDPHSPYIPRGRKDNKALELHLKLVNNPEDLTNEEAKQLKSLYTQECKDLDQDLEGLFDFLQKKLDWENTRVVITSDHGEAFGETGYFEHREHRNGNMHHVQIPLITKGFPLDKTLSYWTIDIYNMLSPDSHNVSSKYPACISYQDLKNSGENIIKKYRPVAIFDLKTIKKINSPQDISFPKHTKILNTISI